MNIFYRHILFLILTCPPLISYGQQQNLPLNRAFGLVNQEVFNDFNNNVHTSFLPINQSCVNKISDTILSNSERQFYLANITKSEKKPQNFWGWIYRSAFYEHLFVVDTGNLYLTIDPLINIEMGKDTQDDTEKNLYKNTRGVMVRANIGKEFSFETSFYENQMVLPQYLTSYANSTGVIPGQGRWKAFKGNQGYDFAAASANMSYAPNKHFNFQLGTGKNFVGDGYRSLLLSDASFNYPFWKIISTFGRKNQFQYTKLNASLSSVIRRTDGSTVEALFKRKTMSTHYFSWLATRWLNLGIFESTLWQTEDAKGTKPLQWQQFNPIIGVNTATTGFNTLNHTVVGTNLKIKLPFKAAIYNQFVYDGKSKYGYQIGAKYFGIPNLSLQAEYNSIKPYTYTSDTRLQAYSNYNEALAHPLGAGFKEIVGLINYKYKRVFTQIKISQANYQFLSNNIFVSDKTAASTDALNDRNTDVSLLSLQAHLGVLINPKNNLSLILGVDKRSENYGELFGSGMSFSPNPTNSAAGLNTTTNYIYLGLRTALRNLYNDF